MKRSIEAHATLDLALPRTLIFDWYNASQENKEELVQKHLQRKWNLNIWMLTILTEMDNYNVTFTENNAVFHVVSKAILPEDSADELLKHNRIGKNLYEEFVTSRVQGEKSEKRKLKTFKSQLAVTGKKENGNMIQLREEKHLLSRFLITSRKRPEIDLEYCLGNFELSVVPRSLLTSDGEPIVCTDKSKTLHHIEQLGSLHEDQSDESTEVNQYESSALIIDGMAVINQTHKD